MHHLHGELRRKTQPIGPVIEVIKSRIPHREVATDFGAGTGYFTIPLARLFKKVYAVEKREERLDYLKKRLEEEKIMNVVPIHSSELPEIRGNLLFLSNVLHELEGPESFLRRASGLYDYVIVIDWKRIPTPRGPPIEERIAEEEAIEMLRRCFARVERFDVYPYHYFLLGMKGRGGEK